MKLMSPFRILVTLWLGCAILSPAWAQQDCSQLLRQAQRSYDDGYLEEALSLIQGCLEQQAFSEEEAGQAYRLITIINLLEKKIPEAENAFLKLLKVNPEFRVDTSLQADPAELVQLYEDFRTDPRFYVGIEVGLNSASVRELRYFDISPDPAYTKEYSPRISFQGGLRLGIPLFNRNVRLYTGLNFVEASYDFRNTFDAFGEPEDAFLFEENSLTDSFRLELFETQRVLQVPLMLHVDFDFRSPYNFVKKKVVPFLYAGVSYHRFLQAAFPEVSIESGLGRFKSTSNYSFGNRTVNGARRKNNFSLIAGAGLKVKSGRNYFTFDLRYSRWIQNVVEPDDRSFYAELAHSFAHLAG